MEATNNITIEFIPRIINENNEEQALGTFDIAKTSDQIHELKYKEVRTFIETRLSGTKKFDVSNYTIFREINDTEIMVTDEDLVRLACDTTDNISITLKIRENREIIIAVFVDLECNKDWVKMDHSKLDRINMCLSPYVFLKLREDDKAGDIKAKMVKEFKYRFNKIEKLARYKLYYNYEGESQEIGETTWRKSTFKQWTLEEFWDKNYPIVYAVSDAENIFEKERSEKRDILDRGAFDSLPMNQSGTIYFSHRAEKLEFEPELYLEIHDKINDRIDPVFLLVRKSLVTKEYTWGGYANLSARIKLGLWTERLALYYRGQLLDPRELIWDHVEKIKRGFNAGHLKMQLEVKRDEPAEFTVQKGLVSRMAHFFGTEPMSVVYDAMGLQNPKFGLLLNDMILERDKMVAECGNLKGCALKVTMVFVPVMPAGGSPKSHLTFWEV